jgi:hypothetical protein
MTLNRDQRTKGKHIGLAPQAQDVDWRRQYPKFSLQYTVAGYCVSDCDQEQKAAFASTLLQIGKRIWLDIMKTSRHGSGSEKLPRYRLKVTIPPHITEDREFFTVVRFWGMAPMIGYVDQGVYYIIWLDRNHVCY